MHVVIVGAGEVGWYLAQRLGAEGNDVVVVEQNEVIAVAIGAELDVQVVVGNAAVPSTLRNISGSKGLTVPNRFGSGVSP